MAALHEGATVSFYALLIWTLLASLASAQEYIIRDANPEGDVILEQRQTYQFTGALAIYGSDGSTYQTTQNGGSGGGSTAVPAQCPADHPVSCSAIQEPY